MNVETALVIIFSWLAGVWSGMFLFLAFLMGASGIDEQKDCPFLDDRNGKGEPR